MISYKYSFYSLFSNFIVVDFFIHAETSIPVMRRPILVVCYTNHALDQFLEGILQFCDSDGKLF